MNFLESVRMALDAIYAHKLRSLLTVLGIVIGVSSVIIIVAIGQGGATELAQSLAGSGNTVSIQPSTDFYMDNNGEIPPDFFTEEDIRGLGNIPEVKKVITNYMRDGNLIYRDKRLDSATVIGMNNRETLELDGRKVEKGSHFTEEDFKSGLAGALIGPNVEEELFGDGGKAVGEIIRIENQPVVVIGVLAPQEGLFGGFDFQSVYIPDKVWNRIFGQGEINRVTLQVDSPEQIESVGERAIKILEANHNIEGQYEVMNLEKIAEGINQVTTIMTLVIGCIAGISLLVGGIGVMNIMLVSVTERTREIGIRKSLGATRGKILMQFLVESVTLCVIGGAVGLAAGAGIANLIAWLSPLPALVSPLVAMGALMFSMLFGVVFGILPANKAAKLDPIQCLRWE
ncbi:ABC transporter permease [Desmospora profundinema]|uniref:ABC transport system permease protein n=1 Tax=Desmospora profundinema TaxID=1571184 RepID=A0ABU1IQC9_9BACL|nr:ABC transporter permease [Desmospora profundinema]MDR6227012.1 putative ABC transport system permease protein [Desmospora profundinema]